MATMPICTPLQTSTEVYLIYLTKNAMAKFTSSSNINLSKFKINIVDTKILNKLLPNGQVHQGIVSLCDPKKNSLFKRQHHK